MEERCSFRVWQRFNSCACARKAVVERDGKSYCKQHDPKAIEERDAARRAALNARLSEERRIRQEKIDKQAELEHKASLADELAAALNKVASSTCTCSTCTTAQAVLVKYEAAKKL